MTMLSTCKTHKSIARYLGVVAILVFGIVSALGTGGDGDGDGAVNDTTWNELIWDDGIDDRTRKWAD